MDLHVTSRVSTLYTSAAPTHRRWPDLSQSFVCALFAV